MSAVEEVKPHLTPEGKFALLLIVSEFLVFILFLIFNEPRMGLSTCISIAMLMIAMRATWRLHEHVWYWIAVAIAITMQVPFILYVPWTNHAYRGIALLPFGLMGYLAAWGCIKLGEKITKQRGDTSSPN